MIYLQSAKQKRRLDETILTMLCARVPVYNWNEWEWGHSSHKTHLKYQRISYSQL